MRQRTGSGVRVMLIGAVCAALLPCGLSAAAADWEFRVKFDKDVREKAFSGRVYLIFTKTPRAPRLGPSWFHPELFVSRRVENWKPGEVIEFSSDDDNIRAYPKPLAEIKLSGYRAQAVARFNPHERRIGTGTGNGFSQVVTLPDTNTARQTPVFVIDRLVAERKFVESKWSKLLEVRSALLSDFHGRNVTLKGAVILPASYYDRPARRYPTIFSIPGFGGTHFRGMTGEPVPEDNEQGVEFLRVMLNADCPLGHHVFADSANNGPVGTALVEELIPAFDKQFRSIAEPSARFLTGHSSGGWSSLWVQISHPDFFGGVWSTAPDPVDFRDFQQINLYREGENMYVDADGRPRPLARRDGRVLLWYKGFADMEWALGPGGQLHSFEAAFSPRGQDGKPLLVWDRQTGEVNTDVARTWKKYDIRLVLERNWETLGPKLAGKLHVFMGGEDTFYLEGATKLLKKSLEKLGSDAVVEIHEGKDHGSLMTGRLRQRIRRDMVKTFLKQHPDWPGQ